MVWIRLEYFIRMAGQRTLKKKKNIQRFKNNQNISNHTNNKKNFFTNK